MFVIGGVIELRAGTVRLSGSSLRVGFVWYCKFGEAACYICS